MKSQINEQVCESAESELLVIVEGTVGGACGYSSSLLVVIPIDNCGIAPTENPTFPYNATYLVAHELTHYFDHGRSDCRDISDSPLLGTWAPEPASDDCTGATSFEPAQTITGEQMAAFLARLYRLVAES